MDQPSDILSELGLPVGKNVDWSLVSASIQAEILKRKTGREVSAPRILKREEWPPDYGSVYLWREKQLAAFENDPTLLRDAKAYYKHHSKEFICHWMDVYEPRNAGTDKPVWLPFILFEKQAEFIDFIDSLIAEQQPGLVEKSRTMGATWCAVGWSVWRWLFWSGSAIGWGSQDANTVDRIGDPKSIFEKLRLTIRRLPPVFQPSRLSHEDLKQYVCTNVDNGSSIVGEVGENIGRGGRSLVYFKDEAAHYKRPEKIEASLSENTNVPIDISSVNGVGNLFHRTREAGVEWSPEAKDLERGYTRVFIMDWSDHPEYDETWYRTKKDAARRKGTPHIFAQEIERNYAASREGVIIHPDWVRAAVDADKVLGLKDDGLWGAALDVADDGEDSNAVALRKGIFIKDLDEWDERDQGRTARRALKMIRPYAPINLQYDCIGVGVGVKTEWNRLTDEKLVPKGINLVAWNAGETCLDPNKPSDPTDKNSPPNRNLYENIKAQGWWMLSQRFYLTYRAVMYTLGTPVEGDEELTWDESDLIVIPKSLRLFEKLVKELSQPVMTESGRLRMMVDKKPSGTPSPNVADSVMMAFWPIPIKRTRMGAFVGPRRIGED